MVPGMPLLSLSSSVAVMKRRRGRGIVRLVGILLRPLDQFLDGLGRMVRRDDDDQREVCDHRQRDERSRRMIGQVRIGGGRDRHHAARADEQRVAIVRLVHHELGRDPPAGAGLVLVDDGLAQDFAELLADQAGKDVVAAAGRERHDHADRLVGIVGGRIALRRGRRERRQDHGRNRKRCAQQRAAELRSFASNVLLSSGTSLPWRQTSEIRIKVDCCLPHARRARAWQPFANASIAVRGSRPASRPPRDSKSEKVKQ